MSLKIEGLYKNFSIPEGSKSVLAGLSLSVGPGEVFALMGANGSGKTTLLKIIAGLVAPTKGEVEVAGISVSAFPALTKAMTGFAGGADNSFYQMLTVRENIDFFARLYGGRGLEAEVFSEISSKLGLTDCLNVKYSHLSSGLRQRLALARAMLNGPGLLLVDELSRSLDEGWQEKVSVYITEYVSRTKAACVVVTHNRSWAAKYADAAGTLVEGKIVIQKQ